MTINLRENIQKTMGWCPNAKALVEEKLLKWRPVPVSAAAKGG